jgi:acetoin utilization deacetylase AcuC-like enzyme
MKTYFSQAHEGHNPAYEFFRGEKVPCFEKPARAEFVRQALVERGHELLKPLQDSRLLIAKVHSERYIKFLESAWQQWVALDPLNASAQPFPSAWAGRDFRTDIEPDNFIAKLGLYSFDSGTPLVEGSWLAAKAGADAAASAAMSVCQGARAAFSASRPPGHHAGADFMGGYCFLNNAAIAAESFLSQGAKRVAILDVDFHHGNGTQSIFYNRSDVVVVNIHGSPLTEYPFYLGHADEIGAGAGQGFNLNLPLPAGTSTPAWFDALAVGIDRVKQHQSDALVVSLGLDTFANDPISKFQLLSPDYLRLGQLIERIELPTVFILEGGYATEELGINAANVIDGFEQGSH